MAEQNRTLLSHVPKGDLRKLIELLEAARAP
jgi:hypothetical protein